MRKSRAPGQAQRSDIQGNRVWNYITRHDRGGDLVRVFGLNFNLEDEMDAKEIIKHYLANHDFDGLYNEQFECGCEIEDLDPCDDGIGNCEPAYKAPCHCGEKCQWHMMTEDNMKTNMISNLLEFVGIGTEWRHC